MSSGARSAHRSQFLDTMKNFVLSSWADRRGAVSKLDKLKYLCICFWLAQRAKEQQSDKIITRCSFQEQEQTRAMEMEGKIVRQSGKK